MAFYHNVYNNIEDEESSSKNRPRAKCIFIVFMDAYNYYYYYYYKGFISADKAYYVRKTSV